MAPVLGDVILATCDFSESVSTTTFSVGLHYRITAHTTGTSFDTYVSELSDTIEDAWYTNSTTGLARVYPTTFRFNRIDWTGVSVPTDQYVYAINQAGGSTDQAYNVRSAVVATHYTGLRGRSYRGRSFIPAPSEGFVTSGGIISSDTINIYNTFWTALKTCGTATDQASLTVYSPKLSTPTIEFNNLVTSSVVRANLGSQRRRRRVD